MLQSFQCQACIVVLTLVQCLCVLLGTHAFLLHRRRCIFAPTAGLIQLCTLSLRFRLVFSVGHLGVRYLRDILYHA